MAGACDLHRQLLLDPASARGAAFIGLDNYRQISTIPIFWQALTNNLWFAVGTIPVSIGLAMLMALWVNDRIAGRTLVRMAYFTPTVLPMIAVANIWLFFYTPQYGLLAQVLAVFGGASQNWLGSKDTALTCVTIVADLEGGGLLHDLLSRGAAADPAEPRRGRGTGGCVAVAIYSGACSFRC